MNRKEKRLRKLARTQASGPRLPKLCGADMELGNFILGAVNDRETCNAAAYALLHDIGGQPRGSLEQPDAEGSSPGVGGAHHSRTAYRDDDGGDWKKSSGVTGGKSLYNPQDWGRKYLRSNGGCAYIDLGHLELCIPEVRSAYDHVACTHAMLRIARQAQVDANETLSAGRKIQVLANNSDGLGNSYGSHLNFLLMRQAWENIFHRRIHYMLYLATYQVSSIVFSGAGKVGSENGRPPVAFQLSARADFFETLVGEQTTYRRPIVNSRDEALCGFRGFGTTDQTTADLMARLHVIFYDNTLCHVAGLLKVGVMQIILTMIECERVDPDLILEDPVAAVLAFSHDCTLQARARTVRGRQYTAIELQSRFLDAASRFVASGACDGVVPRAREIVAIWRDTLTQLRTAAQSGDLDALSPLAPRLDWVLKLSILRRAMEQHPALTWDSPQIKHLDQIYASLDPHEGLYWAYERAGFTQRVVSDARIEQFVHEPPSDTRAWMRAMLLRLASPHEVAYMDWDSIRFRYYEDDHYLPTHRSLDMANPLAFTRAQCEPLLNGADGLDDVLDRLDVPRTDAWGRHDTERWSYERDRVTPPSSYPIVRVCPNEIRAGEQKNDELEQDERSRS